MAVDLTLEGSRPQRRLTVAFRVILAIPHWIFTAVLSVVAFVVIFFAWFAVLVTARMPRGMGELLARILQYQARVYAYGQYLLTDRYPSFVIDPVDYPVMLELDEPPRFNRAAVLFRFFLQLPALLLTQLISSGISVLLFFVWLVTLVAGQVPTSAYLAMAAVLRYQLRTWAYMGMLTSDYPWGLFGDRDDDAPASAFVDEDVLPSSPRVDRLVLNRGAKVLITIALVLGIGSFAFNIANAGSGFHFGTSQELSSAHGAFDDAYDSWEARRVACAGARTPDCERAAGAALRTSVERYVRRLDAIAGPDSATDEYLVVRADLQEIHGYLVDMTEASSREDVMRLRFQIEDAKDVYDRDYVDLLNAVTFG
jgi:hypothetical protein